MTDLEKLNLLKSLLNEGAPASDTVYTFYLDSAEKVICEIRNSDSVESNYELTQIKMAIEMYNKRGAEGQTSHSENGIARNYEASGISQTLLDEVTPFAKTPFSVKRVIT